MAKRRILGELKEIKAYIDNQPIDDHRFLNIDISENLKYMTVIFLGPKLSPYEEIINTIKITLPDNYPNASPEFKFQNKIFHPNISTNGDICVDILKSEWSPIYTIRTVLLSIMSLLTDPNNLSPLNGVAAFMCAAALKSKKDRLKYNKEIQKTDMTNIN